jgi:NADH-quinone oxidoreductase subunit J
MIKEIIFYTFSSILICGSLGVVLFRNPVYSAISLILTFITSAFLWFLLESEFLALILILVYVGAVMVLFLFVIMMLNINEQKKTSRFNSIAPLSLLIGLVILLELITLIWLQSTQFKETEAIVSNALSENNTLELGKLIFSQYLYPFEIAGFILLLGIIISISLTLRTKKGKKTQIISKQVDIDPSKRVQLVDLERGKK